MIRDIDLDHVAVATEHQSEAWPRYAGDLAGEWVGGGDSTGFSSAQVQFANGMKVEVLEPHGVEDNDFLRRFLDATGPGPHHLTFKVKDIRAALEAVEAAGFRPVGVDLRDADWQEAFLHPKEALGVVVQLAQSAGNGDWGSPRPAWLPSPRTDAPAVLEHVCHVVADLDRAVALFGDLLGGEVRASGDVAGARCTDLAWPGPGRVRLLAPTAAPASPWGEWLEGRTGRIHHLAFRVEDPASVRGAVPAREDTWVVPPERNLGVRLVLRPQAPTI